MDKWFFPSRGFGEIEGFSNPALEMFKGEPIKAMAREICQNSLDAVDDDTKPVVVEFQTHFLKNYMEFPGLTALKVVLKRCRVFWENKNDPKIISFLDKALHSTISDKDSGLFVLRISDYNTMGLCGAFSSDEVTPWNSLVKGSAISDKSSSIAAGSFGIGKAAPFVVSSLQTVFYRTFDKEGVRAVQGVTHLASFEEEDVSYGEDKIRRSIGYYGEGTKNQPFVNNDLLNKINNRTEHGTDLFVPGFLFTSSKLDNWTDDIIVEVLENFLYSIFSGKLIVIINQMSINKNTLFNFISKMLPKTKNVAAFYDVIRENEKVIQEVLPFNGMGELSLRILYSPEANKKVLVVRNSGMKISDISGLPKGIGFSAFLELRGNALNEFFRKMENPQHNKWEPNRHPNIVLAKKYKEDIENWVRNIIGEKIKEISGEEIDLNVTAFFSSESDCPNTNNKGEMLENIVDSVRSCEIDKENDTNSKSSSKILLSSGGNGRSSNVRRKGIIDDKGDEKGHRTPTGGQTKGQPTGRKGEFDNSGNDSIYDRSHEIYVTARIIKKENNLNKLIIVSSENVEQCRVEIVTIGENGKPMQLKVKSANGQNINAQVDTGYIKMVCLRANIKYKIVFELIDDHNYAMGVKVYGD